MKIRRENYSIQSNYLNGLSYGFGKNGLERTTLRPGKERALILPFLNVGEETGPIRLRLDDLVADRVPHELAHRMDLQLAHNIGSVGLRGLDADS